jgi:hypothetical protein
MATFSPDNPERVRLAIKQARIKVKNKAECNGISTVTHKGIVILDVGRLRNSLTASVA